MKRVVPLLLLFSIPLWAGKKPLPTLVKQPPKTAEIADLKVPALKQACPNWAWAAAVELMLEKQNVTDYKQSYWILKSAGGELCIETPIDLDQLKHWVDGDYTLMDGRKLHFEGTVISGAPQDVGYLIRLLQDGVPALVLWRGHPYVLQGVEYDEYIYPNNQRMYEARKLMMLDPMGKEPVVFEKLKDDLSDLGGVFAVKVGPIEHWR
ncbi:MAG TPA: hypothetical protein VG897_12715 [Terriglobales bacterium]|nr:hypothetical protein [Terriglobales bacterium]